MKFNNKLLKSAFSFLFALMFLVCVPLNFVFATTQNELESKISKLDEQIQQNQKKLEAVKDDISNQETYINTLQSQINTVDEQLSALDDSIAELNAKIKEVQGEIDKLNSAIEQKQQEVKTQSEALSGRLRALYMAGEASNIQILLSSADFGTFLTRTELLKRVSANDTAMINQLEADIKELNSQKEELDQKKAELDEEKAQLDSQREKVKSRENQLSGLKSKANSALNNLNQNSTLYQKLIVKALEEKEKYSQELAEFLKKNASSSTDGSTATATKGGMLCPVPDANRYISLYFGVTSGYYNPSHPHRGLDITTNGASGKPIVAAASGKVIKAVSGGGYNSGWGNYIQIDHGGGVVTGYAHCNSVAVSVGQYVAAGQKIGTIGSTGAAHGPHLHFEVWLDGVRVDPLPWIKNGSSIRYNP
ncbi:MAG: peptidoglycan DD-metalloendopeptidase family protein [Clostridiales bacterium]|nr:peptidoglycan DD-metalloendopeptidase family protein [Clostridiales bacterium]